MRRGLGDWVCPPATAGKHGDMSDDDSEPAVPNNACTMCGGRGTLNRGEECPVCKGTGIVDVEPPGGQS